ncbi:MAG: cation transporter [Theionarchaea archaeon]|nr:cation transporter [Theionarchaea archaeon]
MDESSIGNAEKAAGITIILLVVLGGIQVFLGEHVSRSVALTANGIDCIGDGFVSFVVWVGLKFFRRSPDSKFHYGYYKFENLASVAAALVMFVLAGYITYRAYNQLVSPEPLSIPLIGALVALLAALMAWGIGLHKYMRGRKLHLKSLELDAFNTIKDGTASFLAVVALVLSSRGYIVADAIVGFIIAAIIVSIGITTIKEASLVLLDACDHECFFKSAQIRKIAESVPSVKSAHVVRLRQTGPVIQGELEIGLKKEMSVKEAHEIREEVLERVKEIFPDIERLTVIPVPFEDHQ